MRLLYAIGFLTRLRIPQKLLQKNDGKRIHYPELLSYFPLAGLLIGFLNFSVFFIFNFVFPPLFTSAAVVVLEILLTGGLHLDGLADTFDGYFSKETSSGKIIEIMKKSNTGVFGVISIVLAILLKIILVYSILTGLGIGTLFNFAGGSLADGSFTDFGPGAIMMFMVLLFTPVFGRLSMNYLFANYEPACKTGSLVLLFKDNSNRASYRMQAFLYSVFYTVAFVAGKYFYLRHINSAVEQNINHRLIYIISIFLIESLFVLFIYSVSVSVTARFFVKKIGGITGDVIGAVSVIAEIYFLFFSLLFLQALRLYSAFLA